MSIRKSVTRRKLVLVVLATAFAGVSLFVWNWLGTAADTPAVKPPPAPGAAPDGWSSTALRNEIRPDFAYEPKGGPDGKGCFAITADRREGLDGCWKKTFPITGGKHYHFAAVYQAKGVTVPRRSIVAELHWRDAAGKAVPLDEQPVTGFLRNSTAMSETEFPTTKATDGKGWTEVSDTYQAPSK